MNFYKIVNDVLYIIDKNDFCEKLYRAEQDGVEINDSDAGVVIVLDESETIIGTGEGVQNLGFILNDDSE